MSLFFGENIPINSSKLRHNVKYIKLATVVESDPKASFSIATPPRCRERFDYFY